MEPAEGELSHLQGREKSMREQLTAARSRLLEAERAFMEAEASLKLRNDEIESLRDADGRRGLPSRRARSRDHDGRPGIGRRACRRSAAERPSNPLELRDRIAELRRQIRGLGPVNEQAPADYGESKERFDFLKGQVDDLTGSEKTLLGAIDELETNIRERLKATFAVVDKSSSATSSRSSRAARRICS